MPRVKIKVERGNGLQQVVVVDTEATKGATIGTNVYDADGTLYVPGSSGVSANIRSGYGILVSGTNPKTVNVNRGASFGWQGTHAWDLPLRAPTGSAAAPSYAFGAQQDLGLYRVGADTLGIATAAALRFQVGAAGQWGIGGATYGEAGDLFISGGASAPPSWLVRASLFANPSASIGLAAVNGSATTAMRSDGAPALDQAIAPTWTGTHTFSGAVNEDPTVLGWSIGLGGGSTVPSEVLTLPAASSGNKIVQRYFDGTNFIFRNVNDDFTASRIWLRIVRSGITVTSQIYGNSTDNPPHTFYGQIIQTTNILAKTSTAYTDGAAAAAGTLLNAPAAGNPTKWIPIDDNGTTRYIPAW